MEVSRGVSISPFLESVAVLPKTKLKKNIKIHSRTAFIACFIILLIIIASHYSTSFLQMKCMIYFIKPLTIHMQVTIGLIQQVIDEPS